MNKLGSSDTWDGNGMASMAESSVLCLPSLTHSPTGLINNSEINNNSYAIIIASRVELFDNGSHTSKEGFCPPNGT
jgi:hypothetical protein